jgi:tetratricopeptide (TPR) repeat protein
MYVDCYFKLGRHSEAAKHIETLLLYIPDNEKYLDYEVDMKSAGGISRVDSLKELYSKMKSPIVFRKLLREIDVKTDEEFFRKNMVADLIKATRKLLPSYFQGISDLYRCKNKAKLIEEILTEKIKELEETNRFSGESQEESPHSLMFLYFIYSHHLWKCNQLEKAMEFCVKAEDYCPTFVEIYILKAKLYKGMYKYDEAARTLKNTHMLDKADRYLTNITAKYCLLNNEIVEGDSIFKSFIFQTSQPEKSIHILQKMFYEVWLGKAYIRQRKWGRGLRQFAFVFQHISEISEDQLEFFQYMLRKVSLVSLSEVVKFNAETVRNDFRFILGFSYLIKYGLRYLRNKEIEDKKIEEFVKANPTEDAKKIKKTLEKRDKANSVPVEKGLEELDLEGKAVLENIGMEKAATALSKSESKDTNLVKLTFTALFDFYFHKSKFLSNIRKDPLRNQVFDQAVSHPKRRAKFYFEKGVAVEFG